MGGRDGKRNALLFRYAAGLFVVHSELPLHFMHIISNRFGVGRAITIELEIYSQKDY